MDIRYLSYGVAALAAAGTAATACRADGPAQVRVEHAAARLVVIPEPRGDISVTVQHGNSRLPQLAVRREGDRIVVDGGVGAGVFGERARCVGSYTTTHLGPMSHAHDSRAVVVPGVGRVEYADLPVVTAHVPMNASVAGDAAVFGEVARADSLQISAAGCGDWTTAEVRGPLLVNMAGSGDVRVAAAGSLRGNLSGSGDLETGPIAGNAELSLAGSGDVVTGAVGGGLSTRIASSGDVRVASVAGPVQANIAGSGEMRIHAGRAPSVKVSIAGSGDFGFDGEAASLAGSVAGSGDIYVARVTGPVSKSVMGSGEVRTGR